MWLFYNWSILLFYNCDYSITLPKQPDFCSLPLSPPHPLGSATRYPRALSVRGHLPQSFFLSILFLSILFPSSLFCLLQSCLINLLCLCQSDSVCSAFPFYSLPTEFPFLCFSVSSLLFMSLSLFLSVLPCFSPSSSSSSSSSFSSIYLCYLTSLSIFLPVFLLSFSVSVLSLCLPLTISLSVSLFTCHTFASL